MTLCSPWRAWRYERGRTGRGDLCGQLTSDGKAIYTVVAATNPTSETLKSVVEHQTRALAMDGKIGRDDARENAMAAGACMKARLQ